ncbi:unnamed protein product [Pedinophyceae sp. YPF-701]|nr:unnamed protein product [Pedinophyceae sp. YPF-701]
MAQRQGAAIDRDEIIRRRFDTQAASVRGPGAIKRLLRSFLDMSAAAQAGDQARLAEAGNRTVREVWHWEEDAKRRAITSTATERELEHYRTLKEEKEAAVQAVRATVATRKRELEEAQAWRQRQEEYEAKRKKIVAVPGRASTIKKIQDTHAKIDAIRQRELAVEAAIALRKRQVQLLVAAAADLRRSVEEDDLVVSMDEAALERLRVLEGQRNVRALAGENDAEEGEADGGGEGRTEEARGDAGDAEAGGAGGERSEQQQTRSGQDTRGGSQAGEMEEGEL